MRKSLNKIKNHEAIKNRPSEGRYKSESDIDRLFPIQCKSAQQSLRQERRAASKCDEPAREQIASLCLYGDTIGDMRTDRRDHAGKQIRHGKTRQQAHGKIGKIHHLLTLFEQACTCKNRAARIRFKTAQAGGTFGHDAGFERGRANILAQDMIQSAPLITASVSRKIVFTALAFAAITAGIAAAGKVYGHRLAAGDYSTSNEERQLTIGQDHLTIPENAIRFPEQRINGAVDQVNLALQWPEMKGYTADAASRFFDIANASSLVFVQMSQSTMTRDMSGRVQPIYQRLFADSSRPGPGGLVIHDFRAGSGYGDEVMLTDPNGGDTPFAVRCILPASPSQATGADCQRDIFAGNDLSIEYRFSANLLPNWKSLDEAVRKYATDRLTH